MRSAAHFRGHPIHPMLIPFPFAFLIGAFLFDLAGRVTGHATFWATGGYLAILGIVAALLAAVPGAGGFAQQVASECVRSVNDPELRGGKCPRQLDQEWRLATGSGGGATGREGEEKEETSRDAGAATAAPDRLIS